MPAISSPSPELAPSVEAQSREPFFGWWIVAAVFVLHGLTTGPIFFAFGVLLDPIAQSLNIGRGPTALVASLLIIVGGTLAPLGGALTGKFPIRRLMYAGVLIWFLGFALATASQSIWMMYLGWGVLVGASTVLVGPLQAAALICNWFVRLRGRALGISLQGMKLGGIVIPVVVSWIMVNYGWRAATAALAIVPALLLVPLIRFFGVEHPKDLGQHPDGDTRSAPTATDDEADWTFRRALRSRDYLLLVAALAGGSLSFTAVTVIFVSHGTDSGLSPAQAALAFSVMNAGAAAGTFLFGTLSDYTPLRASLALALVLMSGGLLAMAQTESATALVLAGAAFGLGSGALMPLMTMGIGALFPAPAVPRMIGLLSALSLPVTMLGAPVSGYIYDTSGSYDLAFRLLIGVCAASLISLAFLRLPEHRT